MAALSVNLLPKELIQKRLQTSKLSTLNKISVAALVALIFLTSVALTIRISQNAQLKRAQDGLAYAESRVSSLSEKEGQALILKNRLELIQKVKGLDSKLKAVFNVVIYLTPTDIQVLEASVDKNSNMSLSLNSSSLSSIETLINNLSNKEKNYDMIQKVDLEGMTFGKDGVYRFILKITPKK